MSDKEYPALSTLPECLDAEVIKSLLDLGDSDPTLFKELVETFLADSPPRLEAMSLAAKAAQAEALERAAHGLKSSAGNMGARILAELCKELEQRGRTGNLEGVEPLVMKAMREFESAGAALRKIDG